MAACHTVLIISCRLQIARILLEVEERREKREGVKTERTRERRESEKRRAEHKTIYKRLKERERAKERLKEKIVQWRQR